MGLFDLFKKGEKTQRPESSYQFLETGFHGDKYLLEIIDFLMKQKVEVFVETGTNVGTTLAYVAKKYPGIQCYSCEPDRKAYELAKKNTKGSSNVKLYNLLSQDFIKKIKAQHPEILKKKTFFWLDAHSWGFDWPLKEEVKFAAENFPKTYLMIDDFKVPHIPDFRFDSYKEQLCAHEFIVDELGNKPYQLVYPAYTEKTSTFHPLQGWGLYVFGEQLEFPEGIINNVKSESKNNA
jgi:hypothetical protein